MVLCKDPQEWQNFKYIAKKKAEDSTTQNKKSMLWALLLK